MTTPISGSTSTTVPTTTTTSSSSAGTPIGSVQGLASNIQWQDMITAIMQQETTRLLDPVTNRIATDQASMAAWSSYQTGAAAVQTAANALRDTAFDGMQSFVGTDSSGRPLVSLTATSAATTGTYQAQVVSLAAADQLGGATYSSATAALNLSGDFYVNGQKVSVTTSDTLNSIRDKINAVNTGATATAVSASILTAGSTANRLVLSSSQQGLEGIQIADGSGGVLAQLGLVDPNSTPVVDSTGGSSSYRFSDSATAIGTLLGASSLPPAAQIKVGNQTITVDLSTDSLASIQQKIVAAGGSASVSSPSFNGQTMAELDVGAPVSAVPGDANSKQIVQLLGFEMGRGSVTQSISDSSAWTDASNAVATGTTALSDLKVGGTGISLGAGDTITVAGTRGDGTQVSTTLTLTGSETVQDLLNKLNSSSAFGGGSQTATASIDSNGKLVLTDSKAGASQLGLSLVVKKADGSTASLGQMAVATQGYDRELVHGSNAQVVIGGTLVTRSSNTISDAIPGVTLNLLLAEPGQTTSLTVARDNSGATTAMQNFVSAYNSLATFVQTQTASGGALPFNMSLRASLRSLTDQLISPVPGVTGQYTMAADVGLTIDKTGQLQLDTTAFGNALTANAAAVKALFATTAQPTTGISYLADTVNTQTGTFAVNITSGATQASALGSGFSGTYTDSGTPDGISITDGATLATADVSIATGDYINTILNKFNSAFQQQNMQLLATAVGGQLKITSTSYGSAAKFNVGFDGGNTNPGTQLGLSVGQSVGTDVVGTIGGVAAVGSGQTLTGASGSAADGLAIQYTGTSSYTGSITHTLGIGSSLSNITDSITRSGDGLIASINTSLQDEINSLTERSQDIQTRLTAQQASLTAQFTAMESALSTLQTQGTALTSSINSLQTSTG